ncbi:N-acetylmuramidase family protein [Xanthomonas oryzae pv. oryzicola]|uniref:N-acetylmuramidase family protein n=1 Tax=Xanthomonas oryzae TaxID=347 RepID=UPI0032475FCF
MNSPLDRLLDAIGDLNYQIIHKEIGRKINGKTTEYGLTEVITGNINDTIELCVARAGGGFKKIYETYIAASRKIVTAQSPSIRFKAKTDRHDGASEAGEKIGRDKNGHPLIVIDKQDVELDFLDRYTGAKLSDQDIQDAAKELRCEPGLIFAIATQESSQSSFIDLDGNKIPAILYERHWFRKLTNPSKNQPSPYEATHPNICGPAYKRAKKNKKGEYVEKKTGNIVQEDDIYGSPGIHQYKRLLIAYKLNQEAALQSCSWGKFQIMGFNYKVAGFASVKEFTKAMSLSDAEHMKAFLKFAKSNPTLLEGLQNKDYEKIAEGHNGGSWRHINPDYATNIEKYYNDYTRTSKK